MTTDSPGQAAISPESVSVARAGERWTRKEEDELVAEVRAGTDVEAIAARHARRPGGIVSRLVKMIPDEDDVPESERLAWITERLADPGFDWRAQLDRRTAARQARRGSRRVSRVGRVSDPETVLAVWQQVTGRVLDERWKAEFLGHKALGDLQAFSSGTLISCGRRLHDARGELVLTAWAAECAAPELTGVPQPAELQASLANAGDAVRALIAVLVEAVRVDGDREILRRRLGLHGSAPETQQIADDLGLSRERVRQRQERAVKAVSSPVGVLPEHRPASEEARDRLARLITGAGGAVEPGRVQALAALGFPLADELAARLVARAAC